MRLATDHEIIGVFGSAELCDICGVGYSAIANWKKKGIPQNRRLQIAVAHPRKLVTDDEGYAYWIEESEFEPPDWVPWHWWMTYLHVRQRCNLGVEDDRLQAVVDALEEIRQAGGDVALALRYASTRRLSIPVEVERK